MGVPLLKSSFVLFHHFVAPFSLVFWFHILNLYGVHLFSLLSIYKINISRDVAFVKLIDFMLLIVFSN
ncbi:MAG: hypothetical protein CMH27_08405 [Micavibrio sp.]|nr:hypothetical protein [Micavibrio sp.]